MNNLAILSILLVTFQFCLCRNIQAFKNMFSSCPNPKTVENFDVNKYSGVWYEIGRMPLKPYDFEKGLKCIRAIYTVNSDGTIKVNNNGINTSSGKYTETLGKASAPNPNDKSKLIVSFNPIGLFETKGNYWVIDTDYDNYSLVYSCSRTFGLKFEYAWILSRKRTIDQVIEARLTQTLKGIVGDAVSTFMKTDQTGCVDQ